jgi:methionyl-tRNA synthetase
MPQPTPGPRRIIVTAALPYANGPIHVGHLVEYLQADFWARFQRMRGHECLYICADDTHGTPIMVEARKRGLRPEDWIARVRDEHLADFEGFGIKFDLYGSTNSEENRELCELFYAEFEKRGCVREKSVEQLYCERDQMFLPDRFVRGGCPNCKSPGQYGDSCDKCGATYAPIELLEPQCAVCGTTPILRSSDHVFFKLDEFRDFLRAWVPAHTQEEVANKQMEWLASELRDWDISRDAPYFGFAIPGKPGKFFYVWVDAPMGYISTTLQWCKANGRSFDDFWRDQAASDVYHFIGKDIVYFHTLFWPAMLEAAGFRKPTQVFVHGFLTVNGEKMSKSKGTFISARTMRECVDPQHLRYYYACKIAGAVHDLDLSVVDFVNRVNSDLVGKITNLGSRGAQMLKKRLGGKLGSMPADGAALARLAASKSEEIAAHYEARDFSRAIVAIRDLADEANRWFDEKAPWKTIAADPEATRGVLTATLALFRALAIYLKPVLPEYADKVARLLGEAPYAWADAQATLPSGREIGDYEHLATRAEAAQLERAIEASRLPGEAPAPGAPPATGPAAPEAATKAATKAAIEAPSPEIDFEAFAKIDLRVARIVSAEAIADADKLLRLEVELEPGVRRHIIAGLKAAYDPATLVGRLTVVVANLKPRKMKFGVSEGMVLAAGAGGRELFILSPDSGALPGQRIK